MFYLWWCLHGGDIARVQWVRFMNAGWLPTFGLSQLALAITQPESQPMEGTRLSQPRRLVTYQDRRQSSIQVLARSGTE